MTAPRLSYLLEPLLGYSVGAACWDDWWHIQEFSSIVYTDRFPPKESFTNEKFLSFYYSSWMLGSAIFLSGVLSTVKQAMFVSHLIYNFLLIYAVFISASVLFKKSQTAGYAFIGLVVFYGGFDFFYGGAIFLHNLLVNRQLDFVHAEWWAHRLGFHLQYSNFFTLLSWTPHHSMSAAASLFGAFCLVRGRQGLAASTAAGLSFSFALFSSAFVVIGAAPVVLWVICRYRVAWDSIAAALCVATAVSLPVIWIYLGRSDPGFEWFVGMASFWSDHKYLGFFAFLLVVTLEFFPVLLCLARDNDKKERGLLLASLVVIISTFFLSYHGTGNYTMRATIVPILALHYAAAPIFAKSIDLIKTRIYLLLLITPFFLGGVWEYMSFTQNALKSALLVGDFQIRAYASNRTHHAPVGELLVEESYEHEYGWYLLENRKPGAKRVLAGSDMELMGNDTVYRLTYRRVVNSLNRLKL